MQTLENLCQQQASAAAYFDVFWVLAVVMGWLAVLPMKRSVAEKGARIGGQSAESAPVSNVTKRRGLGRGRAMDAAPGRG